MMLIVCPTCATTYQIKLAALGTAGRTVRCASCKDSWFATPESAIMEAETALVPVSAAAPTRPPAPPPPDEFADQAGNFAVETFTPSREKAGEAYVLINAPPLAPQHPGPETVVKFEPGEPEKTSDTIAARRAQQKYSDRKERRSALRQIANNSGFAGRIQARPRNNPGLTSANLRRYQNRAKARTSSDPTPSRPVDLIRS